MSFNNGILSLSKQNIYEFSFNSVIGTRAEQQDSFGIKTTDKCIFACVCDGMGGHDGGAVASMITVNSLMKAIEKDQIDVDNFSIYDFYINLLDKLDNDVYMLKKPDRRRLMAGTTLVSVFVLNESVNWLSIGDSSLYILHKDKLSKINRAHNYKLKLDEQLRAKVIDEHMYNQELYKGEALISYLGMGGINLYDANPHPLELIKGDMLILASDGLTKVMSDDEIYEVIKNNSPKDAVDLLMEITAKKCVGKSQDNTTIIIIKIN